MQNKRFASVGIVLLLGVISSACSMNTDATATVQAFALEQTRVALEATSQASGEVMTRQAAVTPTPTPEPTNIPALTSTHTPGPVVIEDDFSQDAGRWTDCSQCLVVDGAMYMGPYPAVDSAKGYIALCKDCGSVEEFSMAVDATYISGASDRGFGFVVWENDGSYIDLEISTWQTIGVWSYDRDKGDSWSAWNSILSPATNSILRPGRLTNRIEVTVLVQDGKKIMTMAFNGTAVQPVELRAGPGRVGLVVGLHSLGVSFDNFYFKGVPVQSTGRSGNTE